MSGFIEPSPALVSANPGGPQDPLGESVLDREQPWLRVYEPKDVRVVIGRGQDPEREVRWLETRADGVPIHRRVSGGGSVVLAPGMVVVAMRLRPLGPDPAMVLLAAAGAVGGLLAGSLDLDIHVRGTGDLAVTAADGLERKILGASLRQTRVLTAYLAVILVRDRISLIERYLSTPSRQPAYRLNRDHRDFCGHLGDGCNPGSVIGLIQDGLARTFADQALVST